MVEWNRCRVRPALCTSKCAQAILYESDARDLVPALKFSRPYYIAPEQANNAGLHNTHWAPYAGVHFTHWYVPMPVLRDLQVEAILADRNGPDGVVG